MRIYIHLYVTKNMFKQFKIICMIYYGQMTHFLDWYVGDIGSLSVIEHLSNIYKDVGPTLAQNEMKKEIHKWSLCCSVFLSSWQIPEWYGIPLCMLWIPLVSKEAAKGLLQCRIGQGENSKQIEEERVGGVRVKPHSHPKRQMQDSG